MHVHKKHTPQPLSGLVLPKVDQIAEITRKKCIFYLYSVFQKYPCLSPLSSWCVPPVAPRSQSSSPQKETAKEISTDIRDSAKAIFELRLALYDTFSKTAVNSVSKNPHLILYTYHRVSVRPC